ncbi:hypothetical protein [Paenibacillus tuaregi]|uniref:hypothetical protein n=1 Tax=Paenibacillus tuaregi TaxID=1816681 RepID=UPI00083996AE|nr:hypothetical protein [Paenibacillus tuaregi]
MLYGLFVLVLAGIVFLVIFNVKNGKKEREAGTKEAARDKAPAREKTPDLVQARESHPSDMGQVGLGQQPGVPGQAERGQAYSPTSPAAPTVHTHDLSRASGQVQNQTKSQEHTGVRHESEDLSGPAYPIQDTPGHKAGLDYDRIAYRSERPESPTEARREPSVMREGAGLSVPRKSGDEMYRQALRQMASPEEALPVEEQQEELQVKPDSDQAYREALRRILEKQSEAREQQNHKEPRQP